MLFPLWRQRTCGLSALVTGQSGDPVVSLIIGGIFKSSKTTPILYEIILTAIRGLF
jgi:hypothetical protein